MNQWNWKILALLLSVMSCAEAALLESTSVVASSTRLAAGLPQAKTVTVVATGTYTLTLTDLGESNPGSGTPFSSLSVVLSQGATRVKLVTVPASSSVATDTVTLAAGEYKAQVLGATTGAGLYGVELRSAANTVVWSDAGGVDGSPASSFSTLTQTLAVTAGQTYAVTLTDRNFPVALNSLQLSIVEGSNLQCTATAVTGGCQFTAIGNTASLNVLATEATGSAGLYSVKVANVATAAVLYGATLPVGVLPQPITVNLPANATYSLTSADLQTPSALSSFRLALVQGAEVPVRQVAPGASAAFTANVGAARLYVMPVAASNSAGLYSVRILQGSAVVHTTVESVETLTSTGLEGYLFTANLPAAGTYTLSLRDFQFPEPLTEFSARVTQGAVLLGTTVSSASPLVISNAQAGEVSIAVLARPGTTGQGIFGLNLISGSGTVPVLDINQGVGGSFQGGSVTTTSAGSYAVSVTDFAAPVLLQNLRVAVTRGSQLVGTIFGAGTIPFDGVPGTYTLNVLATPSAVTSHGMYGFSVVAAPVVTLTASAASVSTGGTVVVSWSASDATSCSASGGLSGSQGTTGSVTTGPLNANTTITLTCIGVAGTTSKSVTVGVEAVPAKDGGGGSVSLAVLLGLLAQLVSHTVVRRSRRVTRYSF
jgi:hypothetical protein